MKTKLLPIVLMIVSIALAVISFILLPDTVITQFSSSNPTTLAKPLAVAIPAAVGVIPSLLCLLGKADEKKTNSYLILSGVGIVVFIIMLIVNL
jgi:FtsH-binding integral membrane protein